MNGPDVVGHDVRQGKRLVAWAIIRAFGTAALLVAVYYLLPLDGHLSASPLVLLTVMLIALVALVASQTMAIMNSPYPGIRAVEAVASSLPLLLISYAITYYLMYASSHANFSQALTRTSALYFAITIFSTVGFGDITPTTDVARIAVTSQMIVDLLVIGIGLRLFLNAIRIGTQRRSKH